MSRQLDLFDRPISEPVVPQRFEVGTKRCPTCHKRFKQIDTSYTTYCPACKRKHQNTVRHLKKDNPIPDAHCCEVCGKYADEIGAFGGKFANMKITPWRLDHYHKTGKFRGYLCNNCNIGLGRFNDDPALLGKAIDYLVVHNRHS